MKTRENPLGTPILDFIRFATAAAWFVAAVRAAAGGLVLPISLQSRGFGAPHSAATRSQENQ
jgi:hypothetical protein